MKMEATETSDFHPAFGRDEATRTPDPYVQNVVRYQLRYIPIFIIGCKDTKKLGVRSDHSEVFLNTGAF